MINKEYVENFIRRVFNYYNGKINTCNIAVLKINWLCLAESEIGGSSFSPNIVEIYPQVISRFVNSEYEYYCTIIETIIHELYHQDQVVDYVLIASNRSYRLNIESAVEVETVIYLANNQIDILNNFGIDMAEFIALSYNNRLSVYDPVNRGYKRRSIFMHYLIVIREIVYDFKTFSKIEDDLLSIASDKKKIRISISLNGSKIYIRNSYDINNWYWIDIESFNRWAYDNFYKYSLHYYNSIEYNNEGSEYSIVINGGQKNIMCI
jgi:hypothetical protein